MRRYFCALITAILMIMCAPGALAGGESPVRLHVLAESDAEPAQALKAIVAAEVAACARALVKDAESAAEAYLILSRNLIRVRAAAERAARDAGYTGGIRVTLNREYFPARLYGDIMLSEGEYNALRVEIGDAQGRNWWCVLYPSLCLYGEPDAQSPGEIHFYSSILALLERLFGGEARA